MLHCRVFHMWNIDEQRDGIYAGAIKRDNDVRFVRFVGCFHEEAESHEQQQSRGACC